MPHLPTFGSHANDDVLQEMVPEDLPPKRRPSLLRKPKEWLRRHRGHSNGPLSPPATAPTEFANLPDYFVTRRPSLPEVASTKRAIPSLPRPQTFRRQNSERRERLLEVEPTSHERRALSADRRRSRGPSASRPHQPLFPLAALSPSTSALGVTHTNHNEPDISEHGKSASNATPKQAPKDVPPLSQPVPTDDPILEQDRNDNQSHIEKSSLQEDFERHWILNLSMHFRDKSNREKFFVTYAGNANQWRRITISLDYRDAPADSLEAELSSLHYQRDKSIRIYEAIRDSLPDIQYYDTVTNLKLETTRDDGQLHVHVREDANEIVQFPATSLFDHVRCPRFNESSLQFDSHLSGFVYKVHLDDRTLIKKEIPGPDTVDEFLYEVNALSSLLGSHNVVQLEGLVTDDRGELVKGLLLSYASQGALVDIIYDYRDRPEMSWPRRERWAEQIVAGLADIHEAGFVQGDFTLSNIVIDEDDNAQIIDINRRGCPVGWESPELSRLINSGQRIGLCIGVKTDLFQLGMVLWALAEQVDEPERVERPLPAVTTEAPRYLQEVIVICLDERPQGRLCAKDLLRYFPRGTEYPRGSGRHSLELSRDLRASEHSEPTSHRSAKEYIDPDLAVTIDEVKDRRRSPPRFTEQVTYLNPDSTGDSAPASSIYRFESSGSWVIGRRSRTSRGRSPVSSRRRRSSPCGRTTSSATSLSEASPLRRPDDETWDTCGTSKDRDGKLSHSRSPSPSRGERRTASPPTNNPLPALQAQNPGLVADLLHTDSGFDEAVDDQDLDLDASNLTETPRVRRVRTYVSDDDDDDVESIDCAPRVASCTPLKAREPPNPWKHVRGLESKDGVDENGDIRQEAVGDAGMTERHMCALSNEQLSD
ncbi:hypothetical protein DOTSEDRAFT_71995 [Dothistroma septosporum NZE10]|uniref:Protein kinase domain-containing protein n=1 Tax=Dothistroma septosporum (strain NZE10 / CBS 128990) TaxID=675120 RepID=N1PN51_DOTSN|nr:hypothetical protein DOTSEDRAFT_71995 [Dothistroma septosporum NZE10]